MSTQARPLTSQAPPQFDLTSAVKDPDFLKAPTPDKIAFLSAHDKDFAQAHPNDQAAYLNHLLGNDQKTEFEKNIPGTGINTEGAGSAVWDVVKNAVKNAPSMFWASLRHLAGPSPTVEGLAGMAQETAEGGARAIAEDQSRKAAGYSPAYRATASYAAPFAPVNPASMEAHAARGEGGAIVGEATAGAGMTVAPSVLSGVARIPAVGKAASKAADFAGSTATKAAGAVSDAASKTVFNEEGKMRPSVRAVSRGVGALAGHASGVPGGELVGALGAPSIVEALTPAREPTVAKAVPLNRSPYYKQNLAKVAAEEAAQKATAEADAEARKPVPLKNSPYYAANKAAAEATAKAESEARQPVPVSQSPYYQQNRAKVAAETKASKAAPVISRPGEGGGPRFTGNEGSPARWTNERVMELARQGNREAIQQAVRRGMELPANARYVAGDADFSSGTYNPRDVTSFGPDGTPIRQGGRVSPVAKPFSGAKAGPEYAYRVHDAGAAPEEFDMERSQAHATTSPEEAVDYQQSRNEGTPQAISRTDVSSLKEGVDYEFVKGPRGNKWVRFKTPRAKGEFVPYEP